MWSVFGCVLFALWKLLQLVACRLPLAILLSLSSTDVTLAVQRPCVLQVSFAK